MKRSTALLLCFLLLLCGCKKQASTKEREDSAGTGYGVSQKSALTLQDLYGLQPGADRSQIQTLLGSPQTFIISESNTDTYRLSDGQTLLLTYNENDTVSTAVLTDTSGQKQDFFSYLNTLGILKNYHPSGEQEETTAPVEEEPEQQETVETPVEETPTVIDPDGSSYFSTKRYSYELADQILSLGAERETVVSALGKPNGYSSVTFEKDSYIIDVYVMDDGSSLYLDYGYTREKLRAVQQVKGGAAVNYLGEWGQEEKPSGYIRYTRNQRVFNTLKKNVKPSELYRRFGAPDWLEGTATRYKDAYQLLDGSVFYLDFGADHSSLTAAYILRSNGTIVNYTLE